MDLDLDCDVDVSATCFYLPVGLIRHILLLCVCFLFTAPRRACFVSPLVSCYSPIGVFLSSSPSFFFSSRRCTHYAMPLVWSDADWGPGQSRHRAILWLSSLLLRLSEHCDHPVIDEATMRRTHSSETDKSTAPPKSSHTSSSHRQEGTGFPLYRYSV